MLRLLALSSTCLVVLAGCSGPPAPEGPACPNTQPPENGGALKPRKTDQFEGVTIARAFGDVGCEYERKDVVCRFTSPAVLEIKTGQGTYNFAPGIGQPAKVTVHKGVAACEMTPKS